MLMECDFLSLNMRTGFIRNLLFPLSPFPISSLRFYPKPKTQYSSSTAIKLIEEEVKYQSVDKYRHPFSFSKKPINYFGKKFDKQESKERRRLRRRGDNKEILRWYSEKLRECSLKGWLRVGKAIHGRVIVRELDLDAHLWISLLNFYVKCGSLECGIKMFDEIPERDVVSWTSLISGFISGGFGDEGIRLYCEMRKEDVRANEFAFATVLKACSMCKGVEFGKQVHGEVVKVGIKDLFVGSALVDVYAKCGEVGYAESVFLNMPEKNDVSWNVLLNGYAQIGDLSKVLKLFSEMPEAEMKFNSFTLSTILKCCASSVNLRGGQIIHSLVIKHECDLDDFLSCTLVDMYSKCEMVNYAFRVFRRIRNPDNVTWSAMISCLYQQGKSREAAKLFGLMRQTSAKPNQFTLASLVSAASDLGDKLYGKSIHAVICKLGFEDHNSVGNALVSMYMKFRNVQDGCRVFEEMIVQDLVSWNALLSGFHDDETCDEGPRIFRQMLVGGFEPNMYTFISILRSCSSLSCIGFGKQVHAHIIKNRMSGNSFVQTALIDMYAKTNFLEDAQVVFNRLSEKDLFTWTVIISGYVHSDQAEKAMNCFRQMQQEGVKPNEFTLASCLSGCSHLATLENGQQLHSMAIKSGYLNDIFVASALVDMYGKCGCTNDAKAVFKGCISRDTILWNTFICGYAQHGEGQEALDAFRSMLGEGITPDEVTFLGVLSACSHMGLIEEGKEQFKALSDTYAITPTVEHYACMVDILGRAGRFDEVKSFVEKMELAPNPLIWETVLGACHLHGNVELGKRAAEKLFELEPVMESSYILLSNIFASKGMWDDVRKVRTLMSSRGIKKEPGCSWVEVENHVHVFLSQDSSHPKIRQIHGKLEELSQKLISVGYTPKTEHVLHNVTDREKKENLTYHSERLALAFSLISSSSSSSKTIRIFKNLRICGDCHDVMKLFSDITKREIIVRDIKRFHHFKNGTCSCRDYW